MEIFIPIQVMVIPLTQRESLLEESIPRGSTHVRFATNQSAQTKRAFGIVRTAPFLLTSQIRFLRNRLNMLQVQIFRLHFH